MAMKKRLRFLYRYITTSRRFRRLFNTQTILILAVSFVFLTTISWTAPQPADEMHREVPSGSNWYQRQAQAAGSLSISNAVERGADQSGAARVEAAEVAQTEPTETPSGPTPTPFPPEFAYNSQQTVGLTLSATILVLIVVFGVLAFMPKKTDS